jgi:hypothetical protein
MTHIARKSTATFAKAQVIDGPNAQTLSDSMLFQRPALVTFSVLLPHPFWKHKDLRREVAARICGINQIKDNVEMLVLFAEAADGSALEGMGAIHYNPVLRKGVWQHLHDYCDPDQVSGIVVDILV